MDDVNYFAFFPFDLNNNCQYCRGIWKYGEKTWKSVEKLPFFL